MALNPTPVILTSTVVAGGTHMAVLLKERGTGSHMLPPLLGTALLAGALLLIAEFWPAGAKGMSIVILLTALVMNGGKVFQLIGSLVD